MAPTTAPSQPLDETLGVESAPENNSAAPDSSEIELRAIIEAVIYLTDEPLSSQQIASALNRPLAAVDKILEALVDDYSRPERGLTIRELAGGYKLSTKPEHHEAVRAFVKNLKPPLKLSLAALETLAVIAYKQPITAPEILEIRGVQGAGVLKTLLDRRLITTSGRKQVVGRPILYRTTKDFMIQFGLKDLTELPTLKEFEELRRMAVDSFEQPPASGAAMAPEPTDTPGESTDTSEEPEASDPR